MMGPSGSGKTTLLSLLAGRSQTNLHSGSITYNDMGYTKALKRRMGFVTQDDVLFMHLTVKETLRYAALLRLPKKLSRQEKIQRADSIILELGLDKCKDTIIGGPFERGVSGGERKRVCIGQEILIDPSIIFLDEPTSGLDSTTALRILQLLHGLAQAGRTVITTIHQPSSRLYHMFDNLLLLSNGHAIFFGRGQDALPYFSSIGLNASLLMNPADFLLDLANGNISDTSIPPELEIKLIQSKGDSKVGKPPELAVQEYLVECFSSEVAFRDSSVDSPPHAKDVILPPRREWSIGWWQQFLVLMSRGFKERRHEYLSWLRVFQVLVSAVVAGLVWWHSSADSEKHLQDQVGLIFFISIYWAYFPIFVAIYTFPQERAMIAKERASDMYRLSSYFMSRTLGDLPLNLVLPLVFLLITYFMAHLKLTVGAFLLTLLSLFLIVIAAEGLGLFIGAAMMDTKHATTLASILLLIFMLTGGFFTHGLASFVKWIKYVSYTFYAFRLLIKVQYSRSQVYDCLSATGCKSIASARVMADVDLNEAGPMEDVFALLLMVVGYRILAYVALKRMNTAR
ncbi:ABC transporter G family member 22 [Selaginella moellendorffii]|uniref:ABC transporter G family member 22 n=1 Tax=Selaginella moellendorffii TaxID=88036 RepID=UPI000D1C2CB0|nr:ABC transporter G family member 22 [Selaginella moellendorffii]|eukprot:XP_002991839.2 ABC transporter G family member 22 [Selaginella moellendorffii]